MSCSVFGASSSKRQSFFRLFFDAQQMQQPKDASQRRDLATKFSGVKKKKLSCTYRRERVSLCVGIKYISVAIWAWIFYRKDLGMFLQNLIFYMGHDGFGRSCFVYGLHSRHNNADNWINKSYFIYVTSRVWLNRIYMSVKNKVDPIFLKAFMCAHKALK